MRPILRLSHEADVYPHGRFVCQAQDRFQRRIGDVVSVRGRIKCEIVIHRPLDDDV